MEEHQVKITSDEKTSTLKADEISLSLRISGFESDKDYVRFVKNVERLVRCCGEYRLWTSFITDTLGYTTCALTNESMFETNVDIHHHPISLYPICKAVIDKFVNDGKQFCSLEIAMHIIGLHFKNKVGYVPLLSDIHKKFHDGYQDIPIDMVHGDYEYLLKNYPFSEEDVDKVNGYKLIKTKDVCTKWSKGNYPGLQKTIDLNKDFNE